MTTQTARDYTPYLKHAREQAARRRRETATRRERAWAVARQIAGFLCQEYHPTRILAFGSIVWGASGYAPGRAGNPGERGLSRP